MTYPQQPYGIDPPAVLAATPQNGFGTSGFVVGLIGLVFSPIPLIGMVSWPLTIIGLVLSGVGLSRANQRIATNRGLAIAGLACSLVGLAVCILWLTAFASMESS